jgi:AcrR family transcriptional regulator
VSPRRAEALRDTAGDPAVVLREHLLDTAERLLAERSVAAVTTRDLARAAGVSDGVLYNYFADKNELLVTALTRRFTHLVERMHSQMPEPGDGTIEGNLQVVAAALARLHSEALPIVGSLLAEPTLLHRFMAAIHSADEPFGGKQITDTVVAYLDAERALGRIAAADLEAATHILVGATVSLVLSGHLAPGPDPVDRLPAVIDTLVHGLAP